MNEFIEVAGQAERIFIHISSLMGPALCLSTLESAINELSS